MSGLQVSREPLCLAKCQRRQMSLDGQVRPVALGESKAADAIDCSPHRTVLSAARSEPQLERPLQRVDIEAIGASIGVDGDSSEEEYGGRAQD